MGWVKLNMFVKHTMAMEGCLCVCNRKLHDDVMMSTSGIQITVHYIQHIILYSHQIWLLSNVHLCGFGALNRIHKVTKVTTVIAVSQWYMAKECFEAIWMFLCLICSRPRYTCVHFAQKYSNILQFQICKYLYLLLLSVYPQMFLCVQ